MTQALTITRGAALAAWRDGARAAEAGEDAGACPFVSSSEVADERVLAAAWMRGHVGAGGARSRTP